MVYYHMDASLLTTLQNYGFSEKEAKVYLTTLEIWSSPASSIARRSEIKRVTVYTILEDLKKRWFATETTKGDVKYYSVISPDSLLRQLEQKYEAFKEKVPELMALADKFGNRPKIQFFEGIEWIKNLYNELLKTKDPIFSFLSDDEIDSKLKDYLNKQFIKLRKNQNIHASVIIRDNDANKEYLNTTKKDKMTDIKLIKDNLIWLEWELVLFWWNKILCALYSPKELTWFIIESQQLYTSLYSIFMFIWNKL